ncbi:fructosyl amino acid oxidase [Diplodia corticola]|uniref:Fructosyl amino acid oxidase n=1 Tax=Diplodia corticola TaxID=236234 RepID=A0A1J9S601_9PEZI|nr:fructosyl amino acid oxidase [Diplodia corticola]OJD40379.1 fructosyl amino acid oxidase [Diplodia corticola]
MAATGATTTTHSGTLIIGAGAFGLSTAYHLALRRSSPASRTSNNDTITVLDPAPAVPSPSAASTDISKIVRADYNTPLYARLAVEAIAAWRSDPLYAGLYHVPGWVLAARERSVPFVEGSVAVARAMGMQGVERLEGGADEVRRRWPVVTGRLDGWNACVWNPAAGWADSGKALGRMAEAAAGMGVRFVQGGAGRMVALVVEEGEGGRRVVRGVVAEDGSTHLAERVVLAAGAWSGVLVDLEGQLTAKGHGVAHIQMTPEEARRYEAMPVMDNLELGYFFPPVVGGVFKLAHSQFLTNTQTTPAGITTSVPRTFEEHPEDDLPLEIEAEMRQNLRRVFPELADRPFCFTRLCWDADTEDRHWLVDRHPKYDGLYLACGGSAHSFKFLPVMGKYVADFLDGKLDPEIAKNWRWRAGEKLEGKDLAHMDPERELNDMTGWRGRRLREKSNPRL